MRLSTPTATVTVDGQVVPVTRVSVASDTSVDLAIPPRNHGAIGGSDADFEWEQPDVLTTAVEHPWSPLYRAKVGAEVTISTGTVEEGVTPAFRGVTDKTSLSLRSGVLRSACVDPLANVDATFSAPALTQFMPPRFGSGTGTRRAVGLSSIWYAAEAMEAIGARYQVPRTRNTVWRQTMAGSAYPSVGLLDSWSKISLGSTPYDPPLWPNFDSTTHGRMACVECYGTGLTDPFWNPDSPWTIYLETDEDTDSEYIVRLRRATSEQGFGIRVTPTTLEPITLNGTGTIFPQASIPRAGVTRIAVRMTSAGTALTWRTDASPTVGSATVSVPGMNVDQLRVLVDCTGLVTRVPPIDIIRGQLSLSVDPEFEARRTFGIDMGTRWFERNIVARDAILDADAVGFLTGLSQQDQALMVTDHDGVVWWGDPTAWGSLPVAHTITDDGTGIDVDDLTYQMQRRPAYSRIRVNGQGTEVTTSVDVNDSPNIIANRVAKDIRMEAGDDPQEFWLEPVEGEYWIGDIDTTPRYAGAPTSEPWHQADDFIRGRGSWIGGYLINNTNEAPVEWATATHVTTTVERVGPWAIKVVVTPGTIPAGQSYVNLPHPLSANLANSPVLRRTLPRITTYGRGVLTPVTGVSADIPGADPRAPEYVHEAGWAATTPEACVALAQEMADRYTQPGVIELDVALCPVRIGQRINVIITGPAALTVDAVVIGIPDLTVEPGNATMRLRLWATSVIRDVTTWGEAAALDAAGITWADAAGGTWGDGGPAETPGTNYGRKQLTTGTGGY